MNDCDQGLQIRLDLTKKKVALGFQPNLCYSKGKSNKSNN